MLNGGMVNAQNHPATLDSLQARPLKKPQICGIAGQPPPLSGVVE